MKRYKTELIILAVSILFCAMAIGFALGRSSVKQLELELEYPEGRELPQETVLNTININTANSRELTALPGIGAVLAEAIVAYRNEHGPFERVDDLMDVPGIGPVTVDRLKDWATVR